MTGTKKWGNTISKKGEASRIFVANISPRQVNCEDLGLLLLPPLTIFNLKRQSRLDSNP
jgi:hypothetical protein